MDIFIIETENHFRENVFVSELLRNPTGTFNVSIDTDLAKAQLFFNRTEAREGLDQTKDQYPNAYVYQLRVNKESGNRAKGFFTLSKQNV